MAKRRSAARRAVARTRTVVKRVRSKSKSGAYNPQKAVVGGFMYGLARPQVAKLLSPISSKIPMGQYADELIMGVLSWQIAKGKVPMIPKNVGLSGLAIESFVVGQDVGSGNFSLGGNTEKTSSGVQIIG